MKLPYFFKCICLGCVNNNAHCPVYIFRSQKGFKLWRNLTGTGWFVCPRRRKDFRAEQFMLPQSWPWPCWSSRCCGLNLFNRWPKMHIPSLTQAQIHRAGMHTYTSANKPQSDIYTEAHINITHLTLQLPVFKLWGMREKSCKEARMLI